MRLVRRMQRRRRYREMSRRLAELDRLDRSGDGPAHIAASRRRRWRPRRGEVGFVVLMMVIIAALVIARVTGLSTPGDTDPGRVTVGHPPLPRDATAGRILPRVTGAPSGTHAFIRTTPDGRPVTYDPCRRIHYVINPMGMPEGGLELVRTAVREISAASGLAFVEDGVTPERPTEHREPRQPQRYGDRWVPVLIGWANPASFPLLSGDIVGIGGSIAVAPGGPASERYVTGQIALDQGWFADAVQHGDDKHARAVVLHELGHLVGLDHVRDPGELMTESSSGVTELGPGDRQGLAAVGAGQCWTGS